MPRIIATMPGRFGDILWSLPTVRALAEVHGQPVEFYVSKKYGDPSFLELIEAQDYIESCRLIQSWEVVEAAPMTPRVPPEPFYRADHVYHLGYVSWPERPLPYAISERAGTMQLDLSKPWIEYGQPNFAGRDELIAIHAGWTSEWKELKYGLMSYLDEKGWECRWAAEAGSPYLERDLCSQEMDWTETAEAMSTSCLFIGDLSAQWVLACAIGTPAVIVEPEPMRHNEIFWVDITNKKGQKMTRMVKGHDGKPTFDWNHVLDELNEAWEEFSK